MRWPMALRKFFVKPYRVDMPEHRAKNHVLDEWVYVAELECWRQMCLECPQMVNLSERKPRGA